MESEWHPSASLNALIQAAAIRRCCRDYLDVSGAMEVVTPVLSQSGATDVHLHSLTTTCTVASPQLAYLHTSPEFAMKRLLAAYRRDVYQLCPVFRDTDVGVRHNIEFTLLEWYRVGMDHLALIDDVERLFQAVATVTECALSPSQRVSYIDAVEGRLGQSFDRLTSDDIAAYFVEHDRSWPTSIGNDKDAALDLFMDEFVTSTFPENCLTFLIDYPVSQAALARTGKDAKGRDVAHRFEVFKGKLELANGFHELTDAVEQRRRFEHDNQQRKKRGLPIVALDERFLNALQRGLPDCAGVAVGLERVVMAFCHHASIAAVMSFDLSRA